MVTIATRTYGDPVQSARDYLRAATDLVGVGKPIAAAAQINAKRITKADVTGQPFVQLIPAGGFGQRGPVDKHFRVALLCYAPTDPEAYDLYEIVSAILVPDQAIRNGWENDAAHVVYVAEEGGPFRDTHAEYLTPFVRSSFGLIVRSRPRV